MVTKLASILARVPGYVPEPEPTAEEIAQRQERVDRENEELRKYEEQQLQQRRTGRIEMFRCTDAMREALVAATYTDTDAVKCARDWFAQRDKPWLVLSGPTGCGKSMAAAAVPAENRTAMFIRADELVRLFSSMFGDQYERQQKLRDTQLLVIDDLGCELDSTRMLPALLDLLDARQSARKHPTIVTTNLTPAAFRERYANDRLNSRMAELVRWEGITSPDLRRAK